MGGAVSNYRQYRLREVTRGYEESKVEFQSNALVLAKSDDLDSHTKAESRANLKSKADDKKTNALEASFQKFPLGEAVGIAALQAVGLIMDNQLGTGRTSFLIVGPLS
jgi:hypothetical protein